MICTPCSGNFRASSREGLAPMRVYADQLGFYEPGAKCLVWTSSNCSGPSTTTRNQDGLCRLGLLGCVFSQVRPAGEGFLVATKPLGCYPGYDGINIILYVQWLTEDHMHSCAMRTCHRNRSYGKFLNHGWWRIWKTLKASFTFQKQNQVVWHSKFWGEDWMERISEASLTIITRQLSLKLDCVK